MKRKKEEELLRKEIEKWIGRDLKMKGKILKKKILIFIKEKTNTKVLVKKNQANMIKD